jgi:hypothetical protein
MVTVWVLHTGTKGTGATMVPLERVTERAPRPEPLAVPRKPRPRQPEDPKPRAPRRFKIVDLMTRQTLAEDVAAREAVDALRGVSSVVDVSVYVWQEERERWRLLTLGERRALWELARAYRRGKRPPAPAASWWTPSFESHALTAASIAAVLLSE